MGVEDIGQISIPSLEFLASTIAWCALRTYVGETTFKNFRCFFGIIFETLQLITDKGSYNHNNIVSNS